MNCPYCAEEIRDQALRCKHCSQDLTLIRPLLTELQKVSERIGEIEASLNALISDPVGLSPAVHTSRVRGIANWQAGLFSFLGISIAHYFVVVLFDTKLTLLYLIAIALPFCMGFLRQTGDGRSILVGIGTAVVVAVCALIEMSMATSLAYEEPLSLIPNPTDAARWMQLTKYGASIALAFVAGIFARSVFNGPSRDLPGKRDTISLLLRKTMSGNIPAEALEKKISTIRSIAMSLIELGGAIGMLFGAIKLTLSQVL